MQATGLQRDDLLRFGREVARLAHRRLIVLRNSGQISEEEYNRLEELVLHTITQENVMVLLDSFEPRCNVNGAVDELIPMPNMLTATGLAMPQKGQAVDRVRRALRALRGGDG